MRTICIIPCSSKKIWDKNHTLLTYPAKDAYVGPFHTKCKEYAKKFHPNDWYILSAKYGFLSPDTPIKNYNISFNKKSDPSISLTETFKQAKSIPCDNIVSLGGKHYVTVIKASFPTIPVSSPLSNCKGIGYMNEKLNQLLNQGDQ